MGISLWACSQIILKGLLYAGFAAGVGGISINLLAPTGNSAFTVVVRRYCLICIAVAAVAAPGLFFIQVGALSDTGIAGMGDRLMLELIWNTNAGPALLWQLGGFAALLLGGGLSAGLAAMAGNKRLHWQIFIVAIAIIGALALATSLAIVGHTAQRPTIVKILLGIHVVAMAWWLGSLWPLRQACTVLGQVDTYTLMRRFSGSANVVVALLVLCGGVLVWQLLESWRQLWTTSYGRLLVLKVASVTLLLGLAAWHKWGLTQRLLANNTVRHRLRRSIGLETGLAGIILAITAILTTVVGPSH